MAWRRPGSLQSPPGEVAFEAKGSAAPGEIPTKNSYEKCAMTSLVGADQSSESIPGRQPRRRQLVQAVDRRACEKLGCQDRGAVVGLRSPAATERRMMTRGRSVAHGSAGQLCR